jgi:hypothetical protein
MKLQQINNFDNSGHHWKFQLNEKTYFLTTPGIINDGKIYRSKSNDNETFRVIGGGMHLDNNEIKPHRVLINLETQSHFIIAMEDFDNELVEKK